MQLAWVAMIFSATSCLPSSPMAVFSVLLMPGGQTYLRKKWKSSSPEVESASANACTAGEDAGAYLLPHLASI